MQLQTIPMTLENNGMISSITLIILGFGLGLQTLLLSHRAVAQNRPAAESPSDYNCLTREVWSPAKRQWCQRVKQLKNRTYHLSDYGEIILENGVYENLTDRLAVTFTGQPDEVVFGDLNQDGQEDAAILQVVSSGGTGIFVYLTAVLNVDEPQGKNTSIFLGDRIDVNRLRIDAGKITLDMIVQGPDEPLCCPTQAVTRTYRIEPQLIQVGGDLDSSLNPLQFLDQGTVAGTSHPFP